MSDCLFCKIANREMDSDIIYEDDDVVAFHDINPQAPTHILIIPRKHIPTMADAQDTDQLLLGKLLLIAKDLANDAGLEENGYRLVMNTGEQGGQAVYHIHLHVLGGRAMQWPPG